MWKSIIITFVKTDMFDNRLNYKFFKIDTRPKSKHVNKQKINKN
jgi:hypothetical protein